MYTWHWLSRQVFFLMVFNTFNQMLQWYLKSGHCHFLSHPFQFIIHY